MDLLLVAIVLYAAGAWGYALTQLVPGVRQNKGGRFGLDDLIVLALIPVLLPFIVVIGEVVGRRRARRARRR